MLGSVGDQLGKGPGQPDPTAQPVLRDVADEHGDGGCCTCCVDPRDTRRGEPHGALDGLGLPHQRSPPWLAEQCYSMHSHHYLVLLKVDRTPPGPVQSGTYVRRLE